MDRAVCTILLFGGRLTKSCEMEGSCQVMYFARKYVERLNSSIDNPNVDLYNFKQAEKYLDMLDNPSEKDQLLAVVIA
jgi:hypothetical protein